MVLTYIIIFTLLLFLEVVYFKVADRFNIIDKPNERSSHSTIVLRGGGIIFTIAMIVWAIVKWLWGMDDGPENLNYLPFLIGLVLVAGVSFVDDIKSLPDSVRLVVQFGSFGLMFWSLGLYDAFAEYGLIVGIGMVLLALIVCVGATNIINFMDGINGITGGYALSVLIPLIILNNPNNISTTLGYSVIENSLLITAILSVLVFCLFNFRPRGKAKCFAGDVGSIGIGFIILFAIGCVVMQTMDVTWLILLLVYGVDGCLTICHRILLHENLGLAHRKHAYQLMANELKLSHVAVSLIYMSMQLVVSLGFIYLCPMVAEANGIGLVSVHWIYLVLALLALCTAYVLFKKKYYYLHEEYLASLHMK